VIPSIKQMEKGAAWLRHAFLIVRRFVAIVGLALLLLRMVGIIQQPILGTPLLSCLRLAPG
jgi:hypothetical protein